MMTTGCRRVIGLALAAWLVGLVDVSAHGPTPQAAPAVQTPTVKPAGARMAVASARPSPGEQESFSYRAEGRRDPFLVLVRRGPEGRAGGKRPEGVAGLSVAEIALKGVLLYRGGYVALVQAPDTRTFVVHPNDRLLDGTVKAITADSIVMVQDVNDPLSLVKQREVRTTLRVAQEIK